MSVSSGPKSVVALLAAQANSRPAAVAIKDGDEVTSYAELWHQITAIADKLLHDRVKPGDHVALLSKNSAAYVACYYGILVADCVVVALNAASKARDLVNWINHSQSRVLICEASHPELTHIRSLLLDVAIIEQPEILAKNRALNARIGPVKNYQPEQLATIIYTSGTSGNPKGVMLSHANLAANVASVASYLQLGKEDIFCNVLPFYYSYGNSVLHTHLSVGATIVLESSSAYPAKLLQSMSNSGITGFSGVASTFGMLLGRASPSAYDLSSLRYVTQAGGPMAPNAIKELQEELPHTQIFVMYGQTEATARVSYLPPHRLQEKIGSVGIPIPGVAIQIRDAQGNHLTAEETGQVCVSGPGIMMGYWRDNTATKAVISDAWLNTGDVGHMDSDGFLYIEGRSSEMIKVGAHRINPLEIEEIICEMEGVREAAAIGVADDLWGQVVNVFVVTHPNSVLVGRDIMLHCKNNLSNYKIPKRVSFVAKLPRTASGKVQRYILKNTNQQSDTETV